MISSLRADNPYEQLIAQIIRLEREPQVRLQAEKANQERLKKVMSDIDSKISALNTLTKKFTEAFQNPFGGKSVTTAENAGFGISAGDSAVVGTHTLEVARLARTDTRISQQFQSGGNAIRTFIDELKRTGPPHQQDRSQTFSISVATPTGADPDARTSISVTVDPVGTTDQEILAEVSTAINDAMRAAADEGLIKREERVSASVVQETSQHARLSLRSGGTGFQNRIIFQDSPDGFLGMLEVAANGVAAGTSGGQVTAVGTSEIDSLLNSKFVLDGITLYRSSNRVTDALQGVTLELNRAGEAATEFTISTDSARIKTDIEAFIKSYNELVTLIEGRSQVDADLKIRGDLAGDSLFTGLRMGLRGDLSRMIADLPADAPHSLQAIGITVERNGRLTLKDADALQKAIENNTDGVRALFSSEDGIAARINTRLERFVGQKGLVKTRQSSIDDRVNRLNSRIKDWDVRLKVREEQLRTEFARLQESMAIYQNQQNTLMSFMYGF